ncbi:hypothetical protein [Streptomyces griseoflavus]|uniref:hypothetical protein n=1 Tax=Streptomyces griseoflavus TaxID=35619 RepID=UPI003D75B9FA
MRVDSDTVRIDTRAAKARTGYRAAGFRAAVHAAVVVLMQALSQRLPGPAP